jgi:hypothetical protein
MRGVKACVILKRPKRDYENVERYLPTPSMQIQDVSFLQSSY